MFKELFWKEIDLEAQKKPEIPFFYGVSKLYWDRRKVKIAVIPFNIIIRYACKFYHWLKWG